MSVAFPRGVIVEAAPSLNDSMEGSPFSPHVTP